VDGSQAENFKRTMLHLAPDLVNAEDDEFWLPPDSVMVCTTVDHCLTQACRYFSYLVAS